MGYRNDCEVHHHKSNRTVQKTTSPATFYVTNGQETRLAFPCWYKEIFPPVLAEHHCRDLHDHFGWPGPRHVDRSCQEWEYAHHEQHCGCLDSSHRHDIAAKQDHRYGENYHFDFCGPYLDLGKLWPIHLTEEGYDKIIVQAGDAKSGISAKGWIDKDKDWVVRVWFKAAIPDLEKPFITSLAVRANNDVLNKIDTVFLGRLIVLPSAMVELPTTGF